MHSSTDSRRHKLRAHHSGRHGWYGQQYCLRLRRSVLRFHPSTRIDITSASNAAQAIAEIDRAIDGAAAERAKLGSFMSRLQHASDNLQNVATNTAASKSRVADADYATETTELARTQIISQASTAMLAQGTR